MVNRKLSLIPGKLQSIFELLLEQILGFMDSVLGNRELSLRYMPIVGTVFILILTSNWLGLLPFVGPLTVKEGLKSVPLFRSPSSDLNFTIALAIISVLAVNIFGSVTIGLWKHLGKFFNFHSPIDFFTGILEFVSEFIKIISFSFRLFGNVFAGEVLLTILGFLVPYAVPLPFIAMEIFVGLVQAFIFSMLTLVFIGMAVSHETAH